MKYVILVFSVLFLFVSAQASEVEFRDWYGTFDDNGRKMIVSFSGSDNTMLSVYIDKHDIFRLHFYPERKVRLATFDHKRMRGMNFNSLYGYDHWIKRMKKYYRMQVWFEGEKRYEQFSLKGFGKAVNWLYE
jgi:hypothetical protein